MPETPQSIPHPALCSGSFQRGGYIPSFTIPAPPQKDQKSISQSSLLQEPLDFIPVMKSAASNELMFDQDHTSCTRKPCARPSLPPYLLYKVSKFCYDISSPFHCHLPSSLHPVRCCEDGVKKHPCRAETVGSVEPWEELSNPSSSSSFKARIIIFSKATLLALRPKLLIFGLI